MFRVTTDGDLSGKPGEVVDIDLLCGRVVMQYGLCVCLKAVQNERDRISVHQRRVSSSFDDIRQTAALSVNTLHSAELLSRQARHSLTH